MTHAFCTFTLTAGCLLLAVGSITTAATLPHKYDRAQVEEFVDGLAVDELGCSMNASADFSALTEDWLMEDYFEKDAQAIWEKWAAFQGRCKAKFGKSNTGWNKAYHYRFHKESRWNELRGQ